jgi:hypothetical protein
VEPCGILWFHTHWEEEKGGAGGGEVLPMGRDVNNLGHMENNQMYKWANVANFSTKLSIKMSRVIGPEPSEKVTDPDRIWIYKHIAKLFKRRTFNRENSDCYFP